MSFLAKYKTALIILSIFFITVTAIVYFTFPKAPPGSPMPGGMGMPPGAMGMPPGMMGKGGGVPVRVAKVVKQDMPEMLQGIGTVQPSDDVLVRSRVDGELVRIHFTEGKRVQAGDLLAEIDPRSYQNALAEAKATLAKNKAQLANARQDLQRYLKLAEQDYIATQEVETQRAKVKEYVGTVEADQAKVDTSALELSYTKVTAPISGRTGLKQVNEGSMIYGSDTAGIVRIINTQPCYVIFTLPESQLSLLREGRRQQRSMNANAPMVVQAWDREQRNMLAVGKLISMDNQIDTATGTIKLKAEFPNENRSLFPNQFVNASLHVRTLYDAITVPAAAIQQGLEGAYVYVVQPDNTAVSRDIVTSLTTNNLAVIKGLQEGDLVVVDGLDRLRENIPVDVVAQTETPIAAKLYQLAPPENTADLDEIITATQIQSQATPDSRIEMTDTQNPTRAHDDPATPHQEQALHSHS